MGTWERLSYIEERAKMVNIHCLFVSGGMFLYEKREVLSEIPANSLCLSELSFYRGR
jgi:hypothetical protein